MSEIGVFIFKILIFIALSVQIYFLIVKIRGNTNKNIQEAKNIQYSKKSLISLLLEYLNTNYKESRIYKRIDIFLLKAGNPMNITPAIYIFIKLILMILIPVYAYINYKNFIMPLFGLITGFFVLDIIIIIEKNNRKIRILNDLPDIIDSLKIQVSSGVPLTASIQELYKIPRDKEFSKLLQLLSARYSLSKDMDSAIAEFKKHFDMIEIEGLCLTLEQNEKTGSSLQLLENQSEVLQSNYFMKIQRETKKKEYVVIVCMILILMNIATVILYPIVSQINQSLDSIFS